MNKPGRKWLQVHLSTAVVMMFFAGALMWANLKNNSTEPVGRIFFTGKMSDELVTISRAKDEINNHRGFWVGRNNSLYGWPETALDYSCTIVIRNEEVTKYFDTKNWKTYGLLIDIFVALALLMIVFIACEWLIRIKARRS